MKSVIIPFILSLFLFPGLKAQDYVLVWSDEFNNPGLPDQSKWGYEKGLIRNSELQYYTENRSENARIEDSVLIIETRKEAWEGSDYTSASLTTHGIGDWLYGKVEISAKVPTGKGTWPALWMMPTYQEYGGWPKSGEIDIMEYIGVEPQNLFYTTHFEGTDGTGHASSGSGGTHQIQDPFDQFIKFSMIWTPEKIEWYANGVKYHEYLKSSDDPRVWPFNREFHIRLSLAYGGTWGGYGGVDDSKLPHSLLIDYVRVFQTRESDGPFTLGIIPSEGGSVEISPALESYPDSTEITLTAIPDEGYSFSAWKHLSGANPYTFVIRKDMKIEALFMDDSELIRNGKFHENTNQWVSYIFDENTAALSMYVVDSMMAIDVYPSPGTNWHAGFQQYNIALDAGDYTLRFDAYADMAEEILIQVAKNYADWSSYVSFDQAIGTDPESHEIPFTMTQDESNARLFFGTGKFEGEFFIDNISLKRAAGVSIHQTEVPGEGERISIYPNPTRGKITLSEEDFQSEQSKTVQLLSLRGELLSECVFSGPQILLDLSSQAPGVYLLRLITGESVSNRRILLVK